jgi:hypothetical protein
LIVPVRRGVGELSSIYSLNPVASTIWQTIATASTKLQITKAIDDEFEVDGAELQVDVEAFLADMAEAGLLSTVEMPA